jgi:hypothetical protein
MKGFGVILIFAGVLGLGVAMNMDTTVYVPGQTIGSGEFSTNIPSQQVHNLGLIFRQLEWIVVSGLVVLSGVLFYGFGEIVEHRHAGTVEKVVQPLTLTDNSTGPDTITKTSEVPEEKGLSEDDFAQLSRGEKLPPKFDERGRPLQPVGFAAFLKSE